MSVTATQTPPPRPTTDTTRASPPIRALDRPAGADCRTAGDSRVWISGTRSHPRMNSSWQSRRALSRTVRPIGQSRSRLLGTYRQTTRGKLRFLGALLLHRSERALRATRDENEPRGLSTYAAAMQPADAPRESSLAEIAREWGRIGCIGFGGPPTHIALLRRLCVEERQWIEAEEFEDGIAATNLLPGPGLDPAGDLLRLAAAGRRRRRSRRAVLHRPRARPHPGPVGRLPGQSPAGTGSSAPRPAPARRCPRWRCMPPRAGPGQLEAHRQRASPAGALGRLRAAGRRCRGHGRALPGARARRLRADRDRGPPQGRPRVAGSSARGRPGGRRARRRGRRPRGAGLGGVQGRCPLLRRRVRHRPAHAARRRDHLPLDDRRPVPQRRRPRPGHPRSGRPDGGRGRLRRRGASAAGCSPRWSPSPRRSSSSWSAARVSTRSGPTTRSSRSSPAPGRPSSAPSPDRPSRSVSRFSTCGRSPCSPALCSGSSSSGAAW